MLRNRSLNATTTALVVIGGLAIWIIRAIHKRRNFSNDATHRLENDLKAKRFEITTVEALRDFLPPKLSGSDINDAPKVLDRLDEQMIGFIKASPFCMLATADRNGLPFCSPKGDDPGFVEVVDSKRILLPDRPGNRLFFGHQNIIENPKVGLCFEIPGTCSTLRVGGTAKLSKCPELLTRLATRGLDATLVIIIDLEYCFFHCAKAYLRSSKWRPDRWSKKPYKVVFGQYFTSVGIAASAIDHFVEKEYKNVEDSVEGRCIEPDN
jgi:uncharacterized protein